MHVSSKWKKGRLPAPKVVIPDPKAVISDPKAVIPDSIRDPLPHDSGLRVVARNDKDRGPQ
jgi:hypothetical protein